MSTVTANRKPREKHLYFGSFGDIIENIFSTYAVAHREYASHTAVTTAGVGICQQA
jgi:hypothetical protein